jgi:hypothetical protein
MADLTDFGLDTSPSLRIHRTLTLGHRQVGKVAVDRRTGDRVYVSERDSEDHRYHGADPWYDVPFDGDAYGLSLELFSPLHDRDIGRVYIPETDTGDVYQFSFHQFVDGHVINDEWEAADRGYEKDIQKIVPIEAAVEVWEDAYQDLYRAQAAFE